MQKVIKQKSYEDAQAKFTLSEVLLDIQGLRIFLQLKTAVTKNILVGDAQVLMGVMEEGYRMSIEKLKTTSFKKYVARYQVSYLRETIQRYCSIWSLVIVARQW